MPGDYLFPKRLFKQGEPLNTAEINEALQVAAERLNGHLGPHNIRAPLDPSLTAEAGTFFRTKVATVDVDSQMQNATSGAAGQSPQPDAQDAFMLEQQTGWQTVTGSEDMLVEVSTGASSLAITAQAAHCMAGNYDGVSAQFRVTMPLFVDPDLKSGLSAGTDAELDFTVFLGADPPAVFTNMPVSDARNFSSPEAQSREVARLIAAGAPGASYVSGSVGEDVVNNGWAAATGYRVRAEGRDLVFTRLTTTATSGVFQVSFFWSSGFSTANPIVPMTQIRDAATFSTFEALSDLPSATNPDGTAAASEPDVVVYYPAQIQYAIRVDGVVMTETITGRFDNEQAPFSPCRIVDPRDPSNDPQNTGPMVGRFRERPDAINIPMHSVRLTASINVEPGDHVVELVVRRVPTGRRRSFTPPPPEVGAPDSDTIYLPSENKVFIYSRQLAVTDVPLEPVDSALFGAPAVVESYDDEDVVTKENLVDTKLQKVADETNDLQAFQVARGAINGDHLEGFSSVIDSAATGVFDIQQTVLSTTHAYTPITGTPVSFGNGRFFHPMPASGWKEIASIALDVPGALVDPLECILTVEANVGIELLSHDNLIQDQMHLAAACFVIAVREANSGNIYAWRPSLAWVNSNNYIAYQRDKTNTQLWPSSGSTPTNKVGLNYLSRYGEHSTTDEVTYSDVPGDFVDVPVTAYVDFTGVVAGTVTRALILPIDRVYLYGAAAWMGRAGSVAKFISSRYSLNAVAMKS